MSKTKTDDSRKDPSDPIIEAEASRVSWWKYLALFGDSPTALILSFGMLALSVAMAHWLNPPPVDPYLSLGPIPQVDPPVIYHATSDEIHRAFEKDGVVAIRGLLSSALLDRLQEASWSKVKKQTTKKKRSGTQFHTVHMGAIMESPTEENVSCPFREVALHSEIPKVAAQLLQLQQNETLRLLRDIVLAKDEEAYICGWHVDDFGFWPATAESPGINAWIALDDMPIGGGGGFAVAVGSHQATWREEAHSATGATTTMPAEGFRSAADMFANRTGSGTCNLKTAAPHLHRRMEETKRIYDVQRGDVIFHTRWLFHRTVPFDRKMVAQHSEEDDPLLYRRYSIRYGPGTARVPPGYGTEPSVLWDEKNGGRTMDEVSRLDGPWYPQCWPNVSQQEMQELASLTRDKYPVAVERQAQRRREMKPYLNKLSREHRRRERQPPK